MNWSYVWLRSLFYKVIGVKNAYDAFDRVYLREPSKMLHLPFAPLILRLLHQLRPFIGRERNPLPRENALLFFLHFPLQNLLLPLGGDVHYPQGVLDEPLFYPLVERSFCLERGRVVDLQQPGLELGVQEHVESAVRLEKGLP